MKRNVRNGIIAQQVRLQAAGQKPSGGRALGALEI